MYIHIIFVLLPMGYPTSSSNNPRQRWSEIFMSLVIGTSSIKLTIMIYRNMAQRDSRKLLLRFECNRENLYIVDRDWSFNIEYTILLKVKQLLYSYIIYTHVFRIGIWRSPNCRQYQFRAKYQRRLRLPKGLWLAFGSDWVNCINIKNLELEREF